MIISKFYKYTDSESIVNLSLVTHISDIEYEESCETEVVTTSFWRRLFRAEIKETWYIIKYYYKVYTTDNYSYTMSCKREGNHKPTDEYRSQVKEPLGVERSNLISALQAYDIQSHPSFEGALEKLSQDDSTASQDAL